jgi:hypothetical protein
LKNFITILFLLSAFIAKSQIQVGSAELPQGNRSGKLTQETYEKLKFLTTTIFVLQESDSLLKSEFENALTQVWTINKFKVILPSERIQYANRPDCAYTSFGGYVIYRENGARSTHIFYDLRFPKLNKNGEVEEWILISRLALFPEDDMWEKIYNSEEFSDKVSGEETMVKLLHTIIHFRNWSPGFIKGYFKRINDLVVKGNTCGEYTEFLDLNNLKHLKTDTLYLPDYIKEDKEKKSHIVWVNLFKEKNLKVENLPFTIAFINQTKLDSMILYRKEKFYYLTYIRSSTDKFVSIFEGTTGNLLYSKYAAVSYNFKKKDLEKIAEVISK